MDSASDTTQGDFPRIAFLGFDGLLVSFGDRLAEPANRAALALRHALEREGWDGVEETTAALVSTYLRFDALAVDCAGPMPIVLDALVASQTGRRRVARRAQAVAVRTVFGTDLAPQLEGGGGAGGPVRRRGPVRPADRGERGCSVQDHRLRPGQPYLGNMLRDIGRSRPEPT